MEPRFRRAAPVLGVRDMTRAVEFYERILGFRAVFRNGDGPAYVVVERDDVQIHLALDRDGSRAGRAGATVHVTAVDAIYDAVRAAAPTCVTRPIENASYGLRDFNVTDPDGNVILIGEPVSM